MLGQWMLAGIQSFSGFALVLHLADAMHSSLKNPDNLFLSIP